MEIVKLKEQDLRKAVDLVKSVFIEFEAPYFSQKGIVEFEKFISYSKILDKFLINELILWGYFIDDKLVGVIALRNKNHISLLFVDKKYHRQKIATKLFFVVEQLCKKSNEKYISVNSSPYALYFYKYLGFIPTEEEKEVNGIRFIPMIYEIK